MVMKERLKTESRLQQRLPSAWVGARVFKREPLDNKKGALNLDYGHCAQRRSRNDDAILNIYIARIAGCQFAAKCFLTRYCTEHSF